MAAALKPEVLRELAQRLADGQWHSGAALAKRAGITRAALAKRLDHLREWGVQVEARSGLGYRLEKPFELLDAARIRRALPAGAPRVTVATTVDSTNAVLLASAAADDPQALLAELQTAGRGRRGRVWHSPFGANLYLSLAWSFPVWPPQISALPLAVGVAAARALADCGVEGVALKWPNDLLLGGRKLGGVLIEHRGEAGASCRTIIGIGINVAMSRRGASAITQPWIALDAALGRGVSRNALAVALIGQLALALGTFAHAGLRPFLAEWQRRDAVAGQAVRVEDGGQAIHGIARGVEESGALRLEVDGAVRRIHSGDVSLRLANSSPPPLAGEG